MRKYSLITNIIGLVMIIAFLAFFFCIWGSIPEIVPTHFNAAGVANDFGSKNTLFIEIGIMVGTFVILAVLEHFPNIWNIPVEVTQKNRARLYAVTAYMIGTLKILLIGIMITGILSSIYTGFPMWVMYILIALIMIVIIAGIIGCFINR